MIIELHRFPAVLATVLAGTTPLTARAQQSTATATLVFDDVTVVDVEHGTLLPAQRVIVVGNRIEVVGGAKGVTIPVGAQVVQAKGRYLIPGLWDMHTHPMTRSNRADFAYPLFLANGITGIRDAWTGAKDDELDTFVRWRQEILAGTRVGPPLQLLAGNVHLPQDSTTAKQEAAEMKAHGANFLKVYPFSYGGMIGAKSVGLPFGGHVGGSPQPDGERSTDSINNISAVEASDGGISIIDHMTSSGGLDTLCGATGTIERCEPVVARLKRNGTWWDPTLVIHFAAGVGSSWVIAPHAQRIYERYRLRSREFLGGRSLRGNWLRDTAGVGPLPHAEADTQVDSAGQPYAMALAQRLDLPILAGTDITWYWGKQLMGSNVSAVVGLALHAELAMLQAEGLTPWRALQAATINPAKMLHATDSLGTVAPGKLADLVLLDANPLEDVTNTTTIRAVVANGRYYDRAELDRILAGVQALVKHRGLPSDGLAP